MANDSTGPRAKRKIGITEAAYRAVRLLAALRNEPLMDAAEYAFQLALAAEEAKRRAPGAEEAR